MIPLELITEQYRGLLPADLILGLGDHSEHLTDDLLTDRELKEFQTFHNPKRRNEYLSSRNLIKDLVSEMGFDHTVFELRKDKLGKPFGTYRGRRINMSLAHSDRKVICGISPSIQIGVDLEPVSRIVSDRLRERMLHADEREDLRNESLVRIWTLKEAMVKLEGKGLRTNLNRIVIRSGSDSEFKGFFNNDKSAIICSFKHEGYWIAVAYYS